MERYEFKEFPIGFCDCGENVCPWEKMDRKEVELYHGCGMNFIMTPRIHMDNPLHVTKTQQMLDDAQDLGMKVLVNVTKLTYNAFTDGETFRADLKRALALFGHHPAAIGFYLGDEPRSSQMEQCQELYRIYCEEAPELLPYLNLNPGQFKDGGDFAENGGCRMLSYDCYSQMNPEESGTDNFYNNLNSYYKMAKAANIPLLSIVLGTGHFRYRAPSEDDLRWQFGACLACGSSALLWFTFHTPSHINYRGGPVDAFGEKTPTYGAMRRLHWQFQRDYADLMNCLTLENAYWINKPVPGLNAYHFGENGGLEGANSLLNVTASHGIPLIASFFRGRGKQAGKTFIMVFNNTVDQADSVTLSAGKDVSHIWMCRGAEWLDWEQYHPDAWFHRMENSADAGFWLAPGQFEVFMIEE